MPRAEDAPLNLRIGSKAPCVIDEYEADFEATREGDVLAILTIRYFVYDDAKADGFKFVGTQPISEVQVTDGEGRALRWKCEQHRETLIRFFFPKPVQHAPATVVLKFRIRGALSGTDENVFLADWVGNFRIPVLKSVYRFRLPAGHAATELSSTPRGARPGKGAGMIEAVQEPHRVTTFSAGFRPPIVARAKAASAVSSRPSSRTQGSVWPLVGCLAVFLIWAIWRGSKSGSDCSSGGSCSSWSSCSSSSCGGSSCGGGGGGGCGGCGSG